MIFHQIHQEDRHIGAGIGETWIQNISDLVKSMMERVGPSAAIVLSIAVGKVLSLIFAPELRLTKFIIETPRPIKL